LTRGLAELGATVTGFEPDPIQAKKNADAPPSESMTLAAYERVTFAEAPAQKLPVESGSVDVVMLSRSLHHVPAELMDEALKEAKRVLRFDGVLLVLEPDIHGQFSQMIRPFHDETAVRALALEALDRAASLFESVEESWFSSEARFEAFDAFKTRMIGMSFNDIVAERIEQPEVQACFEAGRVDDGYRFTNPIRIRLFR
jgi:SAM-dependent methyltransferase